MEALGNLHIGNIIVVETEHGGALGILMRKDKKSITILTTEDEEIELANGDITRVQYAKREALEGSRGMGSHFFGEVLKGEVTKIAESFGGLTANVVVNDEVITIVSKNLQFRLINGDSDLSSGGKIHVNLSGLVEVSGSRRGFMYADLKEIRKHIEVIAGNSQENEDYATEYKKALERIESMEKEIEVYKKALGYDIKG